MYHSITIGNKNTWTDWHLIPASRPLVNPPSVKTNFIEIPGADGTLDLTESLSGRAMYGDRTGQWTFYVDNGHGSWASIYSEIMGYLHGKNFTAVLEDDPFFYYEGRFSVNQWLSEASNSKIVINYEVGPYKLYSITDGDLWLWDPFSFETGVIKSYRNMKVNGVVPLVIYIDGDTLDVVPTIIANYTATGWGLYMYYGNNQYRLEKGNNIFEDVVIHEGSNRLEFRFSRISQSSEQNPKATITIKLIGGRL